MPNIKPIFLKSFFAVILYLNTPFAIAQETIDTSLYSLHLFSDERYKMAQENPGKAYKYFQDGASFFLGKADTINYLNCIAHLSDIEHRRGQFNNSFDLLWDAFPVANKISNKMPLLEIHQMLGILYQVYGKDSIALNHMKQGLSIAKKYALMDEVYKGRLVSCYLDVAIQCVAMEDYKKAIQYLDSCYITNGTNERLYFVDGVFGQVYLEMSDYSKAQHYLNGVIPFLESRGNGFQTSINYYVGKLKSELHVPDSAIYYYQKSLIAIDSLQNNLKLKPIVLESLANEYSKIRQNKKAFEHMKESKLLSDSLFNTQSQQNKALFEIKNRYKEDLIKKEQELFAQNQLLTISNKARTRLRLLIGFIIVSALIGLFTIRLQSKMKRIAYEKKLNDVKNMAILEAKNKELTSNALQIIEKEQVVKELLEALMEKSPDTHKTLGRKYRQTNKKIWEDFHFRFTQTNDQFYKRLLERYPDLTPTDLKHCALIKLNFDSKEMSHLLGISVNSVHMARSRIRKKLGLKRDDSLTNHLAQV